MTGKSKFGPATLAPAKKKPMGALQTFGRNAVGSLFEGSQNLVEDMVNAPIDVANKVTRDVTNFFGKKLPANSDSIIGSPNLPNFQPRNGPPQIPNVTLPKSSRDDLFGAAQMVGEGAATLTSGDMGQFSPSPSQDQAAISQEARAANPISATTGDLFGPALFVTGGRAPLAAVNQFRTIAKNTLASRNGFGFLRGIPKGPSSGGPITTSRRIENAFSSSGVGDFVSRQFPKMAEAGAEGFVVGLLSEGNPLEVAAMASSAQAVGGLSLSLMSGLTGSGSLGAQGLRLAGSAVGLSTIMEMFKQITPGGEDRDFARVFNSFSTNMAKITAVIGAGALFGAAGMGRVNTRESARKSLQSAITLSDAITSLPRNAVFSFLSDWQKDDRIEPVVKKIASDPGYFNAEANRRIQRAFVDGGQSISTILDDLSANVGFSEKLDALF